MASTVAALEGIRLDLLRLQMGTASVDSVTASLEAAQLVGDQISVAVHARGEVERVLRGRRSATSEFDAQLGTGNPAQGNDLPRDVPAGEHTADRAGGDSATPVGGVTATRG